MTIDLELKKQKYAAIREARAATALKRKNQICAVYKVKIDESRLSAKQKTQLKMIFTEAKWLHNEMVSWCNEGHSLFDYKVGPTVTHKDKDMNDIESKLSFMGSQMIQAKVLELKTNLKGMITKYKNKSQTHVGHFKYVSEVTSINLQQYGTTYRIVDINRGKIALQKVHGTIHVNGLHQIKGLECANAKLLSTPLGYYIAITTFKDKENIIHQDKPLIGIDFGCKTSFTLSNGEKYDCSMQESDRLKTLQRKLSRQVKGSEGRRKTVFLIRREHVKITNRKNDYSNKLVHYLTSNYKVVMQDEQIDKWKQNSMNSKKIQHSVLGRVKAKLKQNPDTVVLSKWLPTTKLCTNCGKRIDLKLSDRIFSCDCGVKEDRDIHAAKTMVWLYENIKIGVGRTEFKRVELNRLIDEAMFQNSNINYEA